MLVFLINTFNLDKYVQKAHKLEHNIHKVLKNNVQHRCILVKGGCNKEAFITLSDYSVMMEITDNLSDHNIYRGFRLFKHLLPNDFEKENATYIVLHDTCFLSETFLQRMKEIEKIKFTPSVQWIFGHLFGLFNIGICTYYFVLKRSLDFEGLTFLPKDKGITLEHGEIPTIEGREITPLLSYSIYTLSELHREGSIDENIELYDSHGISSINDGEMMYYIAKISSLGIYKTYRPAYNHQIPILSFNQIRNPKTFDDVRNINFYLRRSFNICFGPFVHYKNMYQENTTRNGLNPNKEQFFVRRS